MIKNTPLMQEALHQERTITNENQNLITQQQQQLQQ